MKSVLNNTQIPKQSFYSREDSYFDYTALSQEDKIKCRKMVEQIILTNEIPEIDSIMYNKLCIVLREMKREYVMQKNFVKSQELEDISKIISSTYIENQHYISKLDTVTKIQHQLDLLTQNNNMIDNFWEEKIAEFVEAKTIERESIIAEKDGKFSRSLSGDLDELPQKYCKMSSHISDLIEREKNLIRSKRFLEAEMIHKEIDTKSKQEYEKKKKEYEISIQKRKKEIDIQYEKRLSAFDMNVEQVLKEFQIQKENDVKHIKTAIENIQTKLINAQSEYIGENDPIINTIINRKDCPNNNDDSLICGTIRNLVLTNKPIERSATSVNIPKRIVDVTTKEKSIALKQKGRKLDSRRWPK